MSAWYGYRRAMKRLLTMTMVGCVSMLLGGPARAGTAAPDLDGVGAALRDNPVYIDANAERALADDEVDELQAAIRGANTPIYIAVLPASATDGAGGDPDEVARQLAEAVGATGHLRGRRRRQFPGREQRAACRSGR